MTKPTIVIDDVRGYHNRNPHSADRVIRGNTYRNLSTVMVVPTLGMIPARVVQSWMHLQLPMNQPFVRLFMEGMLPGEAYNNALEAIFSNDWLKGFRFLLTVEHDNCPEPDALLKLYESIGKFDVVGGLYWLKGTEGYPMCYGQPGVVPKNFAPFMPAPNAVTECNGTGMGFTLFKLDLFKKMDKPWFRDTSTSTQDLEFATRASLVGARFAIDSRSRVGHWDQNSKMMW